MHGWTAFANNISSTPAQDHVSCCRLAVAEIDDRSVAEIYFCTSEDRCVDLPRRNRARRLQPHGSCTPITKATLTRLSLQLQPRCIIGTERARNIKDVESEQLHFFEPERLRGS